MRVFCRFTRKTNVAAFLCVVNVPLIKNEAIIEENTQKIYGCDLTLALQLNGGVRLREYNSAAHKYVIQRQSAKTRGVEWSLSFPEWLGIWIESGCWEMRGRADGTKYCMCRRGDTGPYSANNVFIDTVANNSRDGIGKALRNHGGHIGRKRGSGVSNQLSLSENVQ